MNKKIEGLGGGYFSFWQNNYTAILVCSCHAFRRLLSDNLQISWLNQNKIFLFLVLIRFCMFLPIVNADFKFSFVRADSLLVPDMPMNLLLNLSIYYSQCLLKIHVISIILTFFERFHPLVSLTLSSYCYQRQLLTTYYRFLVVFSINSDIKTVLRAIHFFYYFTLIFISIAIFYYLGC